MKRIFADLWLLMIAVALAGCPRPRTNSVSLQQPSNTCHVTGSIFKERQKKPNGCWLTSAAMLVSWKEQRRITADQLVENLGEPWSKLYLQDAGLPRNQCYDFARALGLKFEWPANHLPGFYCDSIRKFGPLWLTTSDALSSHARLMIGLESKGSDLLVLFIDPRTGRGASQSFETFFQEFEHEANLVVSNRPDLDLPIQIIHLPAQR